jgi:hypothetical protein
MLKVSSVSRLREGDELGGHESDETAEIPHPAMGAARFPDAARKRRPQSL